MSDTFGSPFIEVMSFDEALEVMQRNEDFANSRVTDDQKKIVGDCYVKRYVSFAQGELITIYGEVWSIDTFKENERKCFGETMDDEEAEELNFSILTQTQAYSRGYRFGNWFSILETRGELGSAHISTLTLITKEEFDAAKERGWV